VLDPICQIEGVPHYVVIVAVALIEYWLGKTEKTKSASILELIFNLGKSIVTKTKGKING
jgi:hypothetical protein